MPFIQTQKVLFKHCDPAGIVFYPRYFEMMNDCVEAFFDSIGYPFEEMHKTNGAPTAKIETTFHRPSRHGDILTLTLVLKRIGGASIDVAIDAHAKDEQRVSFRATLVYVNAAGNSCPWPDQIRTAMTPYVESKDP